jgi:hypothetical protein
MRMGALVIGLLSATTSLTAAGTQALTWSVTPAPNVKPGVNDNGLSAVSCASAASCVAVGDEGSNTMQGTPATALIESWNGTRWSLDVSPKAVHKQFNGVSCPAANRCIAVGVNYINSEGDTTTLAEAWNGSKWSIMPTATQENYELLAVSCVSPTACTAVGDKYNSKTGVDLTLVESWNGTRWSVVPSPNRGNFDEFDGVSCAALDACAAIGSSGNIKTLHSNTLAESWNGTKWSIVPSPDVGTAHQDYPAGVSCSSASFCAEVGSYMTPSGNSRTLILSWNGTKWSAAPAPRGQNELGGVSCLSATDCWAFGSSWTQAGNTRTFAELWDGTRWSVQRTPNAGPPTFYDNPFAVSCASARFCAAVGNYGNYATNAPGHNLAVIGTSGT